jgi:hypothetical protein
MRISDSESNTTRVGCVASTSRSTTLVVCDSSTSDG